ncbi:hypothetical protein [Photobacterium ganghwense]|uniref:hypothetical protein n=1 Tax=Photobacterium ganghwense TaxID=320778 RepID=UPI001A8D805C|nr:hypothetical protein [Photobacterium ganghwense]QSV17156.1 hypothetical protein FH974_19655 [Photobacterium ganghwense]
MIAVTKIIITRLEGEFKLCNKPEIFDKPSAILDSTNWMLRQAPTLPKVGYDKHDVEVHWEDGELINFVFNGTSAKNRGHITYSVLGYLRKLFAYELENGLPFYGEKDTPLNLEHRREIAKFAHNREGFKLLVASVNDVLKQAA